MEFGGVACISCAKRLEIRSPQPVQVIVHYSLQDFSFFLTLLKVGWSVAKKYDICSVPFSISVNSRRINFSVFCEG